MINPKPVNLPISNFTAPWIWSVVVKLHKRILPSERDKIMSVFHFLGHLTIGEQVWGKGKWRWDDKTPRSVAANPCLIMKICLARYKTLISQCWYRVSLFQAPRWGKRIEKNCVKTPWRSGRDRVRVLVTIVFNISFPYTSSWYTLWLVKCNILL